MNNQNDISGLRIVQSNPAIGDRGLIHIYGADPSDPKPYILGIHGGGWRNGAQPSLSWIYQRLQGLGVALVLPSYRMVPEFKFRDAYGDLVHLLSWLLENGAAHGLDPSRCLLLGSSAGAHLAMLLATRATKENLPMPHVCGIVNYCGIMDLAEQYALNVERGSTMVEDFLGAKPEQDPALYREASPICHVHERVPPVWMAHGTADKVVPLTQARNMFRALAAAGHAPVCLEARGLGHTMSEVDNFGEMLKPKRLLFEDDALRFISRTFSGRSD